MSRKLIGWVCSALLMTTLLAACGATGAVHAPAATTKLEEQQLSLASYAGGRTAAKASDQASQVDRMIIWNADMSLTVEDAKTAMQQAEAIARDVGGYLVSSEAWLSGEQLQARLTMRVPADQYESAMASLRALAIKVNRESANSQDVTEEYVDLDSRLRHLQAKESQLLEFLDRAEDTEAVLAVYDQVSATQAEIEQVKGRMTYLEKLSAMATINVELLPREAELPVVEEGWAPGRTLRSAARALVNTLEALGSAVIWFGVYVLPILLLVALPVVVVVLVLRGLRRRRLRRQVTP